jgi:eukaryotic-like serine/threonine-protein kinase
MPSLAVGDAEEYVGVGPLTDVRMTVTAQLRAALAERYQIEREIGAGGMATVYLARDVRHERHVALKVLKPDLGAVLGVERFLSEIRVTANLQHPNLLPLFDSGEVDGLLFYVMPYVDGESLRERIRREKQLPVEEAVHIAAAVAGALGYAHTHGVIHRDLKPENILIQAGQPVVADFGIALAVSNAGGNRITQTGLSLGTPQYMSPEQATGDRTIDGRTDIYSLAAVLYEMLTGDPPHTASTAQAVIAKVLTDRPRGVRASRLSIPVHVEAAIEQALEKLPADRFHSAPEFADALTGKGAYAHATSVFADTKRKGSWASSRTMTIALAAGTVAFAGLATYGWLRPSPGADSYLETQLLPPSGQQFSAQPADFALSPDGSRLAFVAGTGQRFGNALWIRGLDTLDAVKLQGTEHAAEPFWSPDGRTLGFFADGYLKTVPAIGGGIKTLCPAPAPLGGSWGSEGRIVFATGTQRVVGRMNVALPNGTCRALDGDAPKALDRPQFLPDGIHFLAGSFGSGPKFVIDAKTGGAQQLLLDGSNPMFVPPHWVFFLNGTGLEAQRFDARRLRLSGTSARIIDGIQTPGGFASYTVSNSGVVVAALATNAPARVIWLDRHGGLLDSTVNPIVGARRNTWTIQLSHDGSRLAYGGWTLLTYELSRNMPKRLQAGLRGSGPWLNPAWAPKDSAIAFSSGSRLNVYHLGANRSEQVADLKTRNVTPTSWTPDGRFIVFTAAPGDSVTNSEIWTFSTDDHAPRPLITGQNVEGGVVSPDGKLIAYVSNETGNPEVYVLPFLGPGTSTRVSVDGGRLPQWDSRNGELLYIAGDGRVMSAAVQTAGGLKVGAPATLVPRSDIGATARALLVAPGAQRIGLFVGETSPVLTVIENWPAKLGPRSR